MNKTSILSKKAFKKSIPLISFIFAVSTTVLTFIDFNSNIKLIIFIGMIVLSILCHVIVYCINIKKKELKLTINNSTLKIVFGDIFKQEAIKVIAFNEYFDTTLDEEIISKTSLHGKYLRQLESTETLDEEISKSEHLKDRVKGKNNSRAKGKKTRYQLGTIHKRQKYFLLAFSKFDEKNRAYLTMNEYVQCLLNMWEDIDIFYNGETVNIPLLGSGITRMKDNTSITDQELLEIIIWSFQISKVKFTYPSKVRIIIHEDKQDKIDLFKIEGVSNGV